MLEPRGAVPGTDASRVLVVDDDEFVVAALERTLRTSGFAEVRSVTDSRDVLPVFEDFQPDIILLDLHVAELDGMAVLRQLRTLTPTGIFLPVVMIAGDDAPDLRRKALALGASDFVARPFDPIEITPRLGNLLRLRELTRDDRAQQRTAQLRAAEIDMANRLALVAEYRDYPDGSHVQRVGRLSAMLAERLGMDHFDVDVIRFAAPLHDIGKIAIPDSILLKPAPLTLDELDVMKSHTTVGARMLAGTQSPILRMAEDIALFHHENWDGTGYTPGLGGESIPLAARIASVADVFDALTHSRPYKRAWSIRETVEWMISVRERKFDPAVIDALTAAMHEIEAEPALSAEWSDEFESVEPLPSL